MANEMNVKRIVAFLVTIVVILGAAVYTTPALLDNMRLGLDLQGGFEILYQAEPMEEGAELTGEALKKTALSLAQRADALGVSEPTVDTEGSSRIRVSLAGVEDERQVRDVMKRPADLTFRSAEGCSNELDYCKIELRGTDFKENAASVYRDEFQQAIVSIEVKDKKQFEDLSRRLVGKRLAIFLDETLLSDPTVQGVFTDGKATITGQRSMQEATELKDIINLGALPLKLTELHTQKVGPSLGQASLEVTLKGGLIGSALILLFMLIFYRVPGIIASFTLIVYTWVLLVVFDWMNVTLTLPGIAAFVLGIGMAVDANIITYERIREEIRSGKTISSALRSGSKNSLPTIMDANLTTIVAGIALFIFGTGSIKGFAVILIFSILVSMLTNVLLSRFLLNLLIRGLPKIKPAHFGVKREHIVDISVGKSNILDEENVPYDIIGHRNKFFAFSIVITIAGIVALVLFNFNYGVDFKSGTRIDFALEERLDKEQVAERLAEAGYTEASISTDDSEATRITLRFAQVLTPEQEMEITELFGADHAEVNTVDPTVANELKKRAIYAVLLASVLIMVYIVIRFEWRFAIAAIVSLLHDAFIVISVFAVFRLEVNLPFIAAVLTVVGYSINDTIVISDRIRDNMRFAKLKSLKDIAHLVNVSTWQTMTRSVNTMLTILFAALALFIFGSDSIRLFSLAMVIGLVSGAYSSIFIANPIWVLLKHKSLSRKKESPAAAAKQ